MQPACKTVILEKKMKRMISVPFNWFLTSRTEQLDRTGTNMASVDGGGPTMRANMPCGCVWHVQKVYRSY